MGKNVFGGNKSKKFARVSNSGGDRNKLRVVEEEGEEYAIVTKMVGNGCNVHCADNVVRLCIIRGKFQGKGKSMNIISAGSWLLVGLRDWETVKDKSIPKCDLLEVYNHVDKERLKSISTTVNWDILINNDVTNLDKINGISRVENIHFITEKEEDYLKTMEAAAKAPADGQTLVFTTDSMISINPYLYSKLSYVPDRDFVPVTLIGFTNTSLMISADLPVSNVREFIDLMQSRPGKFNYGTFGTGTNGHFAAEMFKAATGTDLVHVPFKGGAPMLQALAANEVQAIFIGPGTAIPLIRSGKIKAIGIYSDRRHSLLPSVPTMTEAGYGNIDGANAWWGIMAPAGTPRDVVLNLSDKIIRIFSAADFREKYLIGFALEPALSGPDKFAELLRADREKWARQTRAVNIRLD